MEREDALFCLGILVAGTGGTSGWTDESIEYYVSRLEPLQDPAALLKACQTVVDAWNEPGRARLGPVMEAYKAETRRKQLEQPALPEESEMSRNRLPPWREGVEIARTAYHQECYRLGKQPNEERFESMLAKALGQPGDMRGFRR